MEIILNATHTFITKHPFAESSVMLDNMFTLSINWINSTL